MGGLGFFGALSELLETINPATGIDEFLLAGVERVTLRTDFRVDDGVGRACLKGRAANAGDFDFFVIGGVDTGFHRCADIRF